MEVLCYALASALLVLTGAVVSGCRGACRAKTQRKPRPTTRSAAILRR